MAKERLCDFRDGKISSIPELEAKAMDYAGRGENPTQDYLCIDNWINTVSPSLI